MENASNILEAASKVPDARYMLLDVKPSFLCERILREDEVKRLFHINEDERLEPSKIPKGYVVKIHWEYGVKNGVMEFPIVKEVESHRVSIQSDQVDQVLKEIREDRAEILVAKAEFLDYRLFFPREFSTGGIEMKLSIHGNKMELNGRSYEFKLLQTNVHEGKIRIHAEFQAKNIRTGEKLVLFFCQDGRVEMELGGRPYYVEGIKTDNALNLIGITYPEGGAEYSFNLKPLSEQISRYSYEIPLREGKERSSIGLKEELRRLLGYDAGMELEEGMGSKYGLLAGFDNGRKAYTGTSRLVITVPEGASRIEWIEIVSIEDTMPRLLHEIIEAGGSSKVVNKIGEAGARIVIVGYKEKGISYKRNILMKFLEKTGIPTNVLEDKVDLMYVALPGKKEADGIVKIKEDIVIDEKVVFKKDEVIAIIEVESTVREVDLEKVWEDMREDTFEDLKEHIKLDSYRNVPYGIAIGFSYNPVDVLAGDKSSLGIMMEVYTRSEIENFGG